MRTFQKVSSIVTYIPISNIDTDMIIPKQYLKTIKRSGLGKYLFSDLRYDDVGHPKPEFILNQPTHQHSQILLTEENFGCGSSREHAVWSLLDFGIKVIIAPSFADIFYNNCFKNGILPIILPQEMIYFLLSTAKENNVTVDLNTQIIYVASLEIPFSLDSYRRNVLLSGLDEIGETLLFASQIALFEEQQKSESPWLYSREINHA